MSAADVTADDVVAFWRAAGRERWFTKDAAFDEDIRAHFLGAHEAAAAGRYADWEKTLNGALALILLLDQFPRNMFRDSPRAFATDPQALSVAKRSIGRGFDNKVAADLRGFFYLPFMHAENAVEQERGIALYRSAGDADGVKWAKIHADIIGKFGRFPHLNKVLGRETTPDEQKFLDDGGFAG